MNSPAVKSVVVRLTSDNVQEFEIDTEIFDDPFMEAATRAVEKTKGYKYGIIRPVAECWEKNSPNKLAMYNSYWVLVNASYYAKAELLREKFKMQTDCDLALEPVHSKIIKR